MWDFYLFHHQSISGFYGTLISLVHLKLSLSYIYLLNTERSSSGVRINDLANGLECDIFQNYWLVTTWERSFPVRLDREILKNDEMCNFYQLPASGLVVVTTFSQSSSLIHQRI